jgi:hypothetical protein
VLPPGAGLWNEFRLSRFKHGIELKRIKTTGNQTDKVPGSSSRGTSSGPTYGRVLQQFRKLRQREPG